MNLDNKRLQFLIKSLIDNEITKEQLEELSAMLKMPANDGVVFSEMEEVWNKISEDKSNEISSEDLYSTITSDSRFLNTSLQENFIRPKNRFGLLSYAAVIFLICSIGVGVYFYKTSLKGFRNDKVAVSNKSIDKVINSNKAILTLSDGRQIILDQASQGELAEDSQAVISKTEDGQIVYNLSALKEKDHNGDLIYNTITTPNGGNYQILLQDGTKVWLNAMSSLKFPTVFSSKERVVELTGEGYFEVAGNAAKPFFVKAGGSKIQVIGTHFNVAAYNDDYAIKTSLLEGIVKVHSNSASVTLKPGQQAIQENSSSFINVRNANMDDVMAWKNGYFIFRDEPIEQIMKKISRWYDIDVKYEGDMSGKEFGGKYLKNNTLSELLKSLELTGTVKFNVEGRRVTVMQ